VLASFATTVIVLEPWLNATWALQVAVPEPLAVPPLAATPLTVTDEIPPPPVVASLAVPETVTGLAVTVEPVAGLLIVNVGP